MLLFNVLTSADMLLLPPELGDQSWKSCDCAAMQILLLGGDLGTWSNTGDIRSSLLLKLLWSAREGIVKNHPSKLTTNEFAYYLKIACESKFEEV